MKLKIERKLIGRHGDNGDSICLLKGGGSRDIVLSWRKKSVHCTARDYSEELENEDHARYLG